MRNSNSSFELLENVNEDGGVLYSFDSIAPSSHVSFNVTVVPKLFGIYESTRARVRYSTGLQIEDLDDDERSGYSTSLGRIKIISAIEFKRSTSYWMKEWVIFVVASCLVVFIPFKGWSSTKANNHAILINRKSN